MTVFQTVPLDGMRPMRYRFTKDGNVKMQVVGKGKFFSGWVQTGVLAPGQTPEQFMADKVGEFTKVR